MNSFIYVSPFRYRKSILQQDNSKGSISSGEILKLKKNKVLTDTHFDILSLFTKYKYLTRNALELQLRSTMLNCNGQEITVRQIISMMVKNGLLVREHLEFEDTDLPLPEDEDTSEGGVNEKSRSGCFYRLSFGMAEFLKNKLNMKIDSKELSYDDSTERIIQCLAVNAFAIKCMSKPTCIVGFDMFKSIIVDKTTAIIDAYSKDADHTEYMIYSVRRNPNWVAELTNRLDLLKTYLVNLYKEKKISSAPQLIFICEDDLHALDAYRELKRLNHTFNYLFTTDTRQYNDKFNENLLLVKEDGDKLIINEIPSPLLKKKL